MIRRESTSILHENWLDGIHRGDVFLRVPELGFAHLCLRADEQVTWVFTGDLPTSMEEAARMVEEQGHE